MTALESIPKISELLARLIKLSKDRETGALIQQIQEHQLVIHKALIDANAKIAKLEDEHPKAIAALKEAHRQEVARLTQPQGSSSVYARGGFWQLPR